MNTRNGSLLSAVAIYLQLQETAAAFFFFAVVHRAMSEPALMGRWVIKMENNLKWHSCLDSGQGAVSGWQGSWYGPREIAGFLRVSPQNDSPSMFYCEDFKQSQLGIRTAMHTDWHNTCIICNIYHFDFTHLNIFNISTFWAIRFAVIYWCHLINKSSADNQHKSMSAFDYLVHIG